MTLRLPSFLRPSLSGFESQQLKHSKNSNTQIFPILFSFAHFLIVGRVLDNFTRSIGKVAQLECTTSLEWGRKLYTTWPIAERENKGQSFRDSQTVKQDQRCSLANLLRSVFGRDTHLHALARLHSSCHVIQHIKMFSLRACISRPFVRGREDAPFWMHQGCGGH
jgi:hypothetical protein